MKRNDENMRKPNLFIGSSVEGLEVARAIELQLEDDAEVTLWKNGVFGLGEGTLESLVESLDQFDFAILALTPDDLITSRRVSFQSPRDNVLLELGLFMGHLGRKRTFVIHAREQTLKLPSDLAGVTLLSYAPRQDHNLTAAVSPACTKIRNKISEMGFLKPENLRKQIRDSSGIPNVSAGFFSKTNDDFRRRNLACAAHGMPNPLVVHEVMLHLLRPEPETEMVSTLPGKISSLLGLRQTLMFRPNATQALRDALEAALLHELTHRSRRGEEGADAARVLTSEFRKSAKSVGYLLHSDVEHPALKQMIYSTWPNDRIGHEVSISDLLFEGHQEDVTDLVIQRYVLRVKESFVSIAILPHVFWINGAKLDVKLICEAIKNTDPLVTTIVDGAQAVGNIPIDIEQCDQENTDIDFYIGCGHKWLRGPESVGFARVGRRYKSECRQCEDFLAASDQITDTSGFGLGYRGQQIGTNQRGIGKGLLKTIELIQSQAGGIMEVYRNNLINANALRSIIREEPSLTSLDPPDHLRSNIVSFTTREPNVEYLNRLKESMLREGFTPCSYKIPIHPYSELIDRAFLRLSPGPDMTQDDISCLRDLIHKVQKDG